jgi:hypothetical protein
MQRQRRCLVDSMGAGGGGADVYSLSSNPTRGQKEKTIGFGGQNPYQYISGDNFNGVSWEGGSFKDATNPFKPGDYAGRFGPGKYDYYVAGDIYTDPKQMGADGKPAQLQKLVQYGLSKEGKPVVDEAVAKDARDNDLISGKILDLEKKRSQQEQIKQGAKGTAGAQVAGKAPVAAQGTILTGPSAAQPGALLGNSGNKTLLGG